jgi:hypothetical protein
MDTTKITYQSDTDYHHPLSLSRKLSHSLEGETYAQTVKDHIKVVTDIRNKCVKMMCEFSL